MYGYLPQKTEAALPEFSQVFWWVPQRLRVSNTVLVIGKFKVIASGKAAVLIGISVGSSGKTWRLTKVSSHREGH